MNCTSGCDGLNQVSTRLPCLGSGQDHALTNQPTIRVYKGSSHMSPLAFEKASYWIDRFRIPSNRDKKIKRYNFTVANILAELVFGSDGPSLRIIGLCRTHVSFEVRHIFEEQSNQLSLYYHHSWPRVQAHLEW